MEGRNKLSCLGVFCCKTAMETEVTAKCRKEGQKGGGRERKKERNAEEKKMKKEKNWRK